MSRQLSFDTNEWSDDDWEYASQRPDNYPHAQVGMSEITAPGIKSALDSGEQDIEPDDYDEWKLPELKNEAVARKLKVGGDLTRKSTWVDALRQWDKENPTGTV